MPERCREAKTKLESRYAVRCLRGGGVSAALGVDALEHDEP
jgi:hypothetical protein